MEKKVDIRSRRRGRNRRRMEVLVVKEDGSLELKEVESRRLKVKSVVRFEDEDEEVVRGYLKEIGRYNSEWEEIIKRVRYWLEDEELGFLIYRLI